jgi:hypothetical protein
VSQGSEKKREHKNEGGLLDQHEGVVCLWPQKSKEWNLQEIQIDKRVLPKSGTLGSLRNSTFRSGSFFYYWGSICEAIVGYDCLALCLRFLCGDIGFVYPAMSMVVIGPSLLY